MVAEVLALARSAGLLWWRNFTRMGFWFLAGFSAHLLANYVSVLLGGEFNVAATVIFVLGVIAVVAALILTIASCRPPQLESSESWRTTLILTIGPFLTAYALWGLLENEISDLFVINVALQGLGGYETWSVNLSRIRLYVILAMVAWTGRLLVAAVARRRVRPRGDTPEPPGAPAGWPLRRSCSRGSGWSPRCWPCSCWSGARSPGCRAEPSGPGSARSGISCWPDCRTCSCPST